MTEKKLCLYRVTAEATSYVLLPEGLSEHRAARQASMLVDSSDLFNEASFSADRVTTRVLEGGWEKECLVYHDGGEEYTIEQAWEMSEVPKRLSPTPDRGPALRGHSSITTTIDDVAHFSDDKFSK